MLIKTRSYPRAALVGNPSDGYYGKTMAYTFSNFQADVMLADADSQQNIPEDFTVYPCRGCSTVDQDELNTHSENPDLLLVATIKGFAGYCAEHGITLIDEPFTVGFRSNIPLNVGLAGSSAIVLACYRALMEFYGVTIPPPVLANEILKVEVEQLNISAGLQDRVTQVYQGLVYMDFDRELMKTRGYGNYEVLDSGLLSNLYVAFRRDLSESSNVLHTKLRQRWRTNDVKLAQTLQRCATCAEEARQAIVESQYQQLMKIIDTGFDYRRSAIPSSEGNIEMIDLARAAGASANQAGSGGAITGVFKDESVYENLKAAFAVRGIEVLRPVIAPALELS